MRNDGMSRCDRHHEWSISAGSAGECRTTAWADVITITKWVD
jgi:hypothetical protein